MKLNKFIKLQIEYKYFDFDNSDNSIAEICIELCVKHSRFVFMVKVVIMII